MERKEYVAPAVTVYGDVKELTQGGGNNTERPDGQYITLPDGSTWAGFFS
jgi:hypothetical protein